MIFEFWILFRILCLGLRIFLFGRKKDLIVGGNKIKVGIESKIAILTIDNPPVNALGKNVILEIENILKASVENNNIRAFIITGTGDFFSAKKKNPKS